MRVNRVSRVAMADRRTLVVEDDIQRAMNVQTAVVFNEAQLPKLVHKETHRDRVVPTMSTRVS
jgi:hypothetical protein